MRMAFVTTLMNALALTTLVEYATVQGRSTSVDARTFQQATAIAMAINSTPLVFVEALAQLTPMRMASVTMWTTALGPMTPAVFAMAQERSMSVDVRTFQKATAIAMATNSTPLAFVEALVQLTSMQMASVTSLMNALALTTLVECATVQEKSTSGCTDIPAGDCDCDGNQLDAVGVCGGPCTADVDADGICDDVDDCVGAYDACGVCNGPGEIYECGCADIPEGDCDCNGNQLDALGVCGGPCLADVDGDDICDVDEIDGCQDADACNYNPDATDDDGSCEYTSCAGCTDSVALNYDETATIDDGSCDYCNLLLSTEVLQPIVCEGDENGVVELILGNVVYPDSITIELNGVVQSSTVFLGLGAGSYTVSVSQGTDCAATLDFDVEDGTALSVAIETSNVTCAGEDDGSIDATALSGVLPIEYVLFGPVSETNNSGNFEDLPGGSYILSATDGNGCTFEEVVDVAEPEALSLDVVVTDAAEEGAGAIDLTVEGGTEPYEFDWTKLRQLHF